MDCRDTIYIQGPGLHTCSHTHLLAYTPARIHTCLHTHLLAYAPAHLHTCKIAQLHTWIIAHTSTCCIHTPVDLPLQVIVHTQPGEAVRVRSPTDTAVEVSPNLTTILHTSPAGPLLANKLLYLCLKHYSLASTTVTGIPMKEEQNASSSANYDVELFHHGESHARCRYSLVLSQRFYSGIFQSLLLIICLPGCLCTNNLSPRLLGDVSDMTLARGEGR